MEIFKFEFFLGGCFWFVSGACNTERLFAVRVGSIARDVLAYKPHFAEMITNSHDIGTRRTL